MSNRLSRTGSRLAVVGFLLERHGTGGVFGSEVVKHTGFDSGTVYPILARLEKLGWVVSDWEDGEVAAAQKRPRRRYYRLDGAGVTSAREYCAPREQPHRARRLPAPGAST